MMQLALDIIAVAEIILFVYLGTNVLYILIFAVAGALRSNKPYPEFRKYRHITLLITAYKEDSIIETIVKSALQQDYPSEKIEFILIADSFSEETVEALSAYPIKLVVAAFDQSTKVQSLQLALKHLSPETDFVVLLDADNVMERDCLRKLNYAFESGFSVLQCHRTAKNTNSSFALLDAISEEVNNNIFRNGHRALGLSAALIGSGIAFESGIYRKFIPGLVAVGGFDKELELALMKSRVKIEYLNDAFVYDEKIENSKAFYKQRRRWISAQVYYFGKGILSSIRALFLEGNFDLFNKTMQFSLCPRAMLLGLLIIINLVRLAFLPHLMSVLWFAALILCALAILISVPYYLLNKQAVKAVFSLPLAILLMISALFRVRKANKQFIHTEHHHQSTI